jgi:Mrp family chromosome partitioning ATPase
MAFQLGNLFGTRRPSEKELLELQMPSRELDLPRALQSVVRFAETKQILDHLLSAQRERKLRSLAILSELPREGRSLFAATIATSFGQLVRQKVLVVDCNTHRSPHSLTLERLLESDELAEQEKLEQVRKTLSVNVSIIRLRDWAEGMETMAEYEVKSLMDGPGKNFDLAIFDTCAMAAKNRNNLDPIAIARRCDAALLLVSRRSATRTLMHEIRERLKKEKLDLLGIAVNEGVLV